jgi:hypothetical protein
MQSPLRAGDLPTYKLLVTLHTSLPPFLQPFIVGKVGILPHHTLR